MIGRIRRTSYRTGAVLGDVQAVRRGRIWQRLVNRYLARWVRQVWQ